MPAGKESLGFPQLPGPSLPISSATGLFSCHEVTFLFLLTSQSLSITYLKDSRVVVFSLMFVAFYLYIDPI